MQMKSEHRGLERMIKLAFMSGFPGYALADARLQYNARPTATVLIMSKEHKIGATVTVMLKRFNLALMCGGCVIRFDSVPAPTS